jgi:hypothetical protein
MTQDTIFALATPPGRGAIAVLRLSGPAVAPTLKALGAGGLKPRLAAVRDLNHDGVQRQLNPESPQQGRQPERVSHRHAKQHERGKTANQYKCVHDQTSETVGVLDSWSKVTTAR